MIDVLTQSGAPLCPQLQPQHLQLGPVLLARVELVGLHHLPRAVHELDGAGQLSAGVDHGGWRDDKSSIVVLHIVLQES